MLHLDLSYCILILCVKYHNVDVSRDNQYITIPDICYHLAAVVSIPESLEKPGYTINNNYRSLLNVLHGSVPNAFSGLSSGPFSIINTLIPAFAIVSAAIPPVAPEPIIMTSYGF